MSGADHSAAVIGLGYRGEYGQPPRSLPGMAAWALAAANIHVEYVPALPGGLLGAARRSPEYPQRDGWILAVADHAEARWVVAHELGHLLTGQQVGYSRRGDGGALSDLPGERAANECAAALLIDPDAVARRIFADWTVSQVAGSLGVPVDAIALRWRIAIERREGLPSLTDRQEALVWAGGGLRRGALMKPWRVPIASRPRRLPVVAGPRRPAAEPGC